MSQELDQKALEIYKVKSFQSVRHLIHNNGTMYAIFITNRFRRIGWIAEVEGKYYGTFSKLQLKEKDDIIDYYLTIDRNAKETIDELCKQK